MKMCMQPLKGNLLKYEDFLKNLDQLDEDDLTKDRFLHIADIVKIIIEKTNLQ